MIKFEKVSYEQFKKDCSVLPYEVTEEEIKEAYNKIRLPQRGDPGSAGYDIFTPFAVNLGSAPITVPLGIKVTMPIEIGLFLFPRSGVGFKTGTELANTIGLIDSSYYNNPKNEGHMMAKLEPGFAPLNADAGDRIIQGVFLRVYFTDDDNPLGTERIGGFGSSGK